MKRRPSGAALLVGLLGSGLAGCVDSSGPAVALFAVPRELSASAQGVMVIGAELANASPADAYCVRLSADTGLLTVPTAGAAADGGAVPPARVAAAVLPSSAPRRVYAEYHATGASAIAWIFAELFSGDCVPPAAGTLMARAALELTLPTMTTNQAGSDLGAGTALNDLGASPD